MFSTTPPPAIQTAPSSVPRPRALTHPEEFVTPEMLRPDPPRKKFDPRSIPGYTGRRKTAAEYRAKALGITIEQAKQLQREQRRRVTKPNGGQNGAGTSKRKGGVPTPTGPSPAGAGSPWGWGVMRALERRWRRGKAGTLRAAWWRKRTLASIAVAMTLQGGTVAQLMAMTAREVAALRGRMPAFAWRWVSEWLATRRCGPWLGRRVFREAVVRSALRACGYGPGALLRMQVAS